MTYLSDEKGTRTGKPRELFRFKGTYSDFFYTTGPRAVTFQAPDDAVANTYLPIAMQRSEIKAGTQEDDGLDINIEMPVNTALVSAYGFSQTPPKLELTIFRYHNLLEWVKYWQGPINNISIADGMATFRSPSTLAIALVGELPNVYYQSPCNHNLYDSRCAVIEANFSFNTTVTAINGRNVTLGGVGTLDGKLIGGEVRNAKNERRMIVAQLGNVVTVNFPFTTGLQVGNAVTICAGCDHQFLGDCKNKFANQLNFGGFPFIPPENVFQQGLEPGKKLTDNTCLPPRAVYEGWYLELRYNMYNAAGLKITNHLNEPHLPINSGMNIGITPKVGNWVPGSTSNNEDSRPVQYRRYQNGVLFTPGDAIVPATTAARIITYYAQDGTTTPTLENPRPTVLEFFTQIQHDSQTISAGTRGYFDYRWWEQNEGTSKPGWTRVPFADYVLPLDGLTDDGTWPIGGLYPYERTFKIRRPA